MENVIVNKRSYLWLGALQAFIALGALGGGFMLLSDPSGRALELPLSLLEGSPFPDFLIPAIFLFTVNGVGSIIGAVLSFSRNRFAPEIAALLGFFLIAWIVIQVIIIYSIHWLQLLYFILGAVELSIGRHLRRQRFNAG